MTFKSNVDIAKELFVGICQEVGSPYSKAAQKAALDGDWSTVFRQKISPAEYEDARTFALDYGVCTYLKKYEAGADRKLLRANALSTFQEVEKGNSHTNSRIRHSFLNGNVEGIISYARRKIERLLGEFNWDEFLSHVEWGSGASASIPRHKASVDKKCLEPRLSVTRRCLKYARAYLEHDIHWMSARLGEPLQGPACPLWTEFQIIDYGQFDVVEKDNRSMRTIDKQPTCNLFFQKGVGKMLRKRLRRAGINLDDQSRNQYYASVAQRDRLATIDLANASNSVSSELVRLLFANCTEWFQVLDETRTHSVNIDGAVQKLEMFSAMGNGFTFELESLIFYALACGVADEADCHDCVIAVYGDDIIIDQHLSKRLVSVLSECGFTVNDDKSFLAGRFYESCGKHYFDGVDVTPLYQKEEVIDTPSCVRAANRLIRWAARVGYGIYIDDILHPVYTAAKKFALRFHEQVVHRRAVAMRRLRGRRPKDAALPFPRQPFWLEGDGALIDVEYQPRFDVNGIGRLAVFRTVSIKFEADHGAIYATSLRRNCVVESPFNGMVTVKDHTRTIITTQRVYCVRDRGPVWASFLS